MISIQFVLSILHVVTGSMGVIIVDIYVMDIMPITMSSYFSNFVIVI